MSAPDPLITRLERLGADEWRPEPPPQLVLPHEAQATPRRRRALTLRPLPASPPPCSCWPSVPAVP